MSREFSPDLVTIPQDMQQLLLIGKHVAPAEDAVKRISEAAERLDPIELAMESLAAAGIIIDRVAEDSSENDLIANALADTEDRMSSTGISQLEAALARRAIARGAVIKADQIMQRHEDNTSLGKLYEHTAKFDDEPVLDIVDIALNGLRFGRRTTSAENLIKADGILRTLFAGKVKIDPTTDPNDPGQAPTNSGDQSTSRKTSHKVAS